MKTPVEVLKPQAVALDWAGIKAHIVDLLTLVAFGLECAARFTLAGVWIAGALLVLGFWVLCLGAIIVLLTQAPVASPILDHGAAPPPTQHWGVLGRESK
jgi:hypothetical protein